MIATGSELHVALEGARAVTGQRARRLDAVRGAVRPSARRLPRRRVASRQRAPAVGRGGHHPRLGAVRRDFDRHRPLRRLRPGRACLRRSWGSRCPLSPRRSRRCCNEGRCRLRPSRRQAARAPCSRRSPPVDDPVDLGTDTDAVRIDYPDQALAVAMAIRRGEAERGVLVCGSGVGASIAASKIPGIRAAICHDSYSAHQGVEHDDMNVLCLGLGGRRALTREGARAGVSQCALWRRRAVPAPPRKDARVRKDVQWLSHGCTS